MRSQKKGLQALAVAVLASVGVALFALRVVAVVAVVAFGAATMFQLGTYYDARDATPLALPRLPLPHRFDTYDSFQGTLAIWVRLSPGQMTDVLYGEAEFGSVNEWGDVVAAGLGPQVAIPVCTADLTSPCPSDFVFAGACGGGASWVAALRPATGDLWITVQYADPSGDEPAC